jgi:hypothetical protein
LGSDPVFNSVIRALAEQQTGLTLLFFSSFFDFFEWGSSGSGQPDPAAMNDRRQTRILI